MEKENQILDSPTKQRTPRQLPYHKEVGIYFAQSKNTIAKSSVIIDSSESDEESGDTDFMEDSQKKRKKRKSDSLGNKVSKIRKTFIDNVSFVDEENEDFKETEVLKKVLQDSLSSNIELTIKNELAAVTDDSNSKENLNTQGTDTLEGFDDFFEEEWCYKTETNDTQEDLDNLFENDWHTDDDTCIDFSTPKRCIIIDIVWEKTSITLTVKDVIKEESATVQCFGIWRYTKIEPGEPIVIKAKKETDKKVWIIDNNFGWIINQPDSLISGTSVVGALFCNRRSIFQEKFKAIETLPFNDCGNNYMLTGSLSHELMQKILEEDIRDIKKMNALLDEILKSKHAVHMMYSAGISMGDCKNLMRPAVAQIYKFVQRYIIGIQPDVPDQNFSGKIEKICDIEENVWLPELGLKGKIDLTVEVTKKENTLFPTVRRTLPLEVKTGRSTFSSEHQGQLILYTIMMDMTGRKVDSGLLLYLRENIMKEIKGSNHAQRDLITLRNTVAYYSTRQATIVKVKDQETCLPMEFPKPINHHSCSKCPYNILCSAYLTENDKKEMSDDHHLKSISENVTSHLKQVHIDYVIKWVSLLQLEEMTDNQDLPSWKDVWTLKPKKREKRGSCISNLNLISVSNKYGRFLHEFQKSKENNELGEISNTDFYKQEYIIISTNNRINICSGFINEITLRSISVYCDKDITKVYNDNIFHIDKNSSSTLLTQNMAQLGGLLENHEICLKLRKIIIDREPATFKTDLPASIVEVGADIFSKLNINQKEAILKALSTDNYMLIKGFPGTGKTQTLVAMIELLVRLEKSVLVTAHTNTAVDNILVRLLERKIDFVRFGSSSKTHPSVLPMLDENLTKDCDSPESLHTVYCSRKVVGVTCYGSTHPHFSRRKFDFCIIDESTQVLQPTILRPLFCASKFILVGDPEQLPPIAKNNTARKLGMNESLFSRLDTKNNTVALTLQYRMNNCIMDIANKLTYHDQLQVGNQSVGNATIPVINVAAFEFCEKWVRKTLSLRLKNSALMLNTSATYHLTPDSELASISRTCNYWETSIILRLIEVLKSLGIESQEIGIIAPYRAQVRLLQSKIHGGIEVNTVDQYQGRDKSVIIYSCTKSISKDTEISEFNILEDHQRLTVAVTRAKHKLIIIGDLTTLQRFTPFSKFITSLRSHNAIYDLKDGEDDFCFEDLMRLLH